MSTESASRYTMRRHNDTEDQAELSLQEQFEGQLTVGLLILLAILLRSL